MIAEVWVAKGGGRVCECGVSKEAEFGDLIVIVCHDSRYAHLPRLDMTKQEYCSLDWIDGHSLADRYGERMLPRSKIHTTESVNPAQKQKASSQQ